MCNLRPQIYKLARNGNRTLLPEATNAKPVNFPTAVNYKRKMLRELSTGGADKCLAVVRSERVQATSSVSITDKFNKTFLSKI